MTSVEIGAIGIAATSITFAIGVIGGKFWNNKGLRDDMNELKSNVVYRDLCEERSKRIEGKVDSLKESQEREFGEVKQLIRNGGHDEPRVRT